MSHTFGVDSDESARLGVADPRLGVSYAFSVHLPPNRFQNMNRDRGILYIAAGPRHFGEMLQSAQTVRKHHPDIPIAVITDQPAENLALFDQVLPLDDPKFSFIDKIAPLARTPFERTIFLDTDTYVCHPIDDLFELLERFEFAVSHAPLRHDRPFVTPNCFCELNTGVIAYRKTPGVLKLFADWLRLYEKEVAETGKMDSDQPTFRQAIWESDIRFYILTADYNLRTVMPAASGRGRVRILHGRSSDMHRIARWVNSSASIRLFLPDMRHLDRKHFQILSPVGQGVGRIVSVVTGSIDWAEKTWWKIKGKRN